VSRSRSRTQIPPRRSRPTRLDSRHGVASGSCWAPHRPQGFVLTCCSPAGVLRPSGSQCVLLAQGLIPDDTVPRQNRDADRGNAHALVRSYATGKETARGGRARQPPRSSIQRSGKHTIDSEPCRGSPPKITTSQGLNQRGASWAFGDHHQRLAVWLTLA
jgi:hypothetical protein